ncbi:MAG TPA: ATP-binding protein, partial [Gemmatimonadaceae bacterium]
ADELRESKDALETLIAASPLAIVSLNNEGVVESWNPAAERLFGWSAEEVIGRPSQILHPDYATDEERRQSALMAGASLRAVPVIRRHKDGRDVEAELHAAPLRDAYGATHGWVHVYEDVAERRRAKEMELQLRHSEKLAAAGEIAALAAHEINNPLGAINMTANVLLCSPEYALNDEAKREIEVIQEQAFRASEVVQRLLQFARRTASPKAPLHVNDLVRRSLGIVTQMFRSTNITVTLELAADLPSVYGDMQQLESVLVNLAVNAEHAMRRFGEGELTVRTYREGDQVVLEVLDTGTGIPDDVLPRIFEPYFTTKPDGEGTGIGLSVAKRTIQDHDGRITAENRSTGGACFRIRLPAWSEVGTEAEATAPTPAAPEPNESELAAARDARILIVDDEEVYRQQIGEYLRLKGYQTLPTPNGFEALEHILQNECDLAVVDIRMPELSGPALWDILGEIAPHFRSRIVFMTGDAMNSATREFIDVSGRPVLRKPFATAELERVVRTLAGEVLPAA